MKRKHKVIFATASIILVLALSVLPAFAFPSGPASLNFCGLGTEYGTGESEYIFTMEKWDDMQNHTTYPDATIYWEAEQGGFDYGGFPDFYINPGDTICITLWWMGLSGGMSILPFSNPTDFYYIFNELVIVNNYDGTSKTLPLLYVQAYNSQGLAHQDQPNWSGTNSTMGGFGGLQDPPIQYIEFWYTYTGNESQNVEWMSMRFTTITQSVPIQAGGAYGIYTEFAPYNREWFLQDGGQGGNFNDQDIANAFNQGYREGYDEGKKQGYDEGKDDGFDEGYREGKDDAENPPPVQSWSNFIFTAVSGILSFEIYPNFPLWGLLSAIVAIPLLIAFLKIFAGG